jgi:hypothetical protein
MLTCEVPYKNLDQNSIMWGVGSHKLRLPIPHSAPEGIKLLLQQCWNVKPRNRPSFSQILKHLNILMNTEVLLKVDDEYFKNQICWKAEISQKMSEQKLETSNIQHYNLENDLIEKRKEELKHATDIRELYEQKLEKANNLYIELSTVLLQLGEREKEIIKREKALNIEPKRTVHNLLKKEFHDRHTKTYSHQQQQQQHQQQKKNSTSSSSSNESHNNNKIDYLVETSYNETIVTKMNSNHSKLNRRNSIHSIHSNTTQVQSYSLKKEVEKGFNTIDFKQKRSRKSITVINNYEKTLLQGDDPPKRINSQMPIKRTFSGGKGSITFKKNSQLNSNNKNNKVNIFKI